MMRVFLIASALACATVIPCSGESLSDRTNLCLACHGESGQSKDAEVPSLGAEPAFYVLIQLYLFRENQRKVDVMNEATKGLTDDDLRQLSDSIAKLPAPKPPPESPDSARMERGRELVHKYRCGFCHNRDFAGHDNVPRLAAQREDYLIKSLREYKVNSRPGYDATMAEVTQPIPEPEILDLAYFMARVR